MTPERWQKVDEVLQAALDLPAAERAALLAETCTGDPELQREALSLITAHDEAGDFLEAPALETDAQVLLEAEEPDREIGPYKIVSRLGRGGMGEVFLAQDRRLGRLVALKTLPSYFVSDDERLRRFQNEARAASALNHPNILTIYEVGESDSTHFIAAEYIEGQTLRELISAGDLTLGEVLDITAELLSGLSAAHAAGIIHRDIKPENIMRRANGSIKILDFGIAKLMEPWEETTVSFTHNQTQTGALMGTIGYVSPEQLRGLPVDERTDIWSCGIVLHEMLTGRRPFAGVTNADTIVAILERPPASLFVSDPKFSALAQLQRMVSKALSKQAEARYRSAAEMLEDLRRIKRSLGDVSKKRPAISGETTINELRTLTAVKSSARVRRFLVPGLVAATLLLIMAGLLYRQSRPGTPNAPPTQKTYAQMNEAEQLAFVSEQEQRISAMMGDRPVKLNDEAVRVIKSHVDYYVAQRPGATSPNGEGLPVRYQRAKPYIPVIARAFGARRIPVVVGIYLAMFESAYHPCPENSWGAKGLFQFLPQTAEHYGVARSEMCDVNKMAPAAAHYIADRMAELGDDSQSMTLVLLSFNRGAEAVRDALRQLRETDRNYERNFWTLFANRDKLDETFRNESANYVPGFFAVAIIGENPETFELGTPPLSSLAR
ncbi:MAG TPA: serine/threonine-protein kinase [Pyrinomonadaceae bacterium]|nr:serine/threonine-protein kinase [Pyrinomonadaceae bacterium]